MVNLGTYRQSVGIKSGSVQFPMGLLYQAFSQQKDQSTSEKWDNGSQRRSKLQRYKEFYEMLYSGYDISVTFMNS